jgi:hypothetical protein
MRLSLDEQIAPSDIGGLIRALTHLAQTISG